MLKGVAGLALDEEVDLVNWIAFLIDVLVLYHFDWLQKWAHEANEVRRLMPEKLYIFH